MKMTSGGFEILRKQFGTLEQSFVDGVNLVVAESEKEELEYNQTAYVLATAYHESAGTFLPVKEAYWLSENWRKQNLRYYPYYGRGLVQITWKENYSKAGNKLGYGEQFANNPDMVMDQDISVKILVRGSKEGWFTTRKLSDYIDKEQSKKDYTNARRIINGMDKATKIANEAIVFEKALRSY